MVSQKELPLSWTSVIHTPSNSTERLNALLNHPLGAAAWSNPNQYGAFDVQDFWDIRSEGQHRYNTKWPQNHYDIASVLLAGGLKEHQIDFAIRMQAKIQSSSITNQLQLHRLLHERMGMPVSYKNAMQCLTTDAEVHSSLELGQGHERLAFLRSHRRPEEWVTMFHALVQYDSSKPAQEYYFQQVQNLFEAVKEPVGAFPSRGLRRERLEAQAVEYNYGWQSTGSALVQVLSDIDNENLAKWLHGKHDLHALGQMVVRGRLSFSDFLGMVAYPCDGPDIPLAPGYRSQSITPQEQRQEYAVETIRTLFQVLPTETLRSEGEMFMKRDPTAARQIQAYVPLQPESDAIDSWWRWNQSLFSNGLINPDVPSDNWVKNLAVLDTLLVNSQSLNYHSSFAANSEILNAEFSKFASSSPTLANTAFKNVLSSVHRHGKPTENWELIKEADLSWLKQANISSLLNFDLLEQSRYNGRTHQLAFIATILPQMNKEDQAHVAPIVAYGCGVQNIQSLAPSTLRSIWKDQFPDAFKTSIPKQYTNDTYILYALTRINADDLMKTLDSMELRTNKDAYLHSVGAWTRQALSLPEISLPLDSMSSLFEM